ncbi:hypothetical protein STEG23_008128 [Scotinomys teguina]
MAQRSIVGCRIAHQWKENNGLITEWIGTVLYQVPVKPSLYMVKYDGVDCVYALELRKDKRILSLTLLSDTVEQSQACDASLADTIIGKEVDHLFEGKHGSKDKWRGLVLSQVPNLNGWFYISYEKDPILFMYQLLDDYKEGDLQIIPESNKAPPQDVDMELVDGLIGKWKELENSILNEVTQTQKDKHVKQYSLGRNHLHNNPQVCGLQHGDPLLTANTHL